MKKFYFALLFFSVMIFVSCNNKTDSLQFEKNVMYEIYPALMDSVWVNSAHSFIPPPPPSVDTLEHQLKKIKESNKRFNDQLASMKKSNLRIGTVILDKIVKTGENQTELKAHFKDAVIDENIIPDTLEYKIDPKKFDAYKTFRLKYLSKIPRMGERKYYNEVGYNDGRGIIHFTRIRFDASKKYGILYAGIYCGLMCDNGYRIFIKKEKEKWLIDKIEEAWIA